MSITHQKVSLRSPSVDAGEVQPADWNATHTSNEVWNFGFSNGGSVLATGVQYDVVIPASGTITGWTLLADQSGSVVIDIWSDTYANYPPVVGDAITASAKPTISSATKATSTTLTGWTTALVAGRTLRFNINSVSTITRVTLALSITTS